MTQISRYIIDTKVTGTDKWIGSDSETQNTTKNFTPNKLSVYFNENQVIDIGTPIRYRYDILEPLDDRLPGTITFEPQVGTPYNFSSITSFILSKYTLKGNDVSNYLNFLVGKKVLISKADDVNIFGYYELTSLVQNLLEPNFFDVTLSYITGNGSIVEDKDYLISLVDGAGGIIPTRTSDLINDGEDGVHPFITLQDIVTPTLDQVLTTGNTSLLDAKVGRIYLYDTSNNDGYVNMGGSKNRISFYNKTGDNMAYIGSNSIYINYIAADHTIPGSASIRVNNLTASRIYYLPNASGTIALTSDIPSVTGYVPYTGATTDINIGTHKITADDGITNSEVSPSLLAVENAAGTSYGLLEYNQLTMLNPAGSIGITASGITFPNASLQTTAFPPTGGTSSQYIKGDGTLATFPSVTGFVPYTGANASVNLGIYGISGSTSSFSTASGNTSRFTSYELNDNIDAQIGRIVLQGGEYLFYTSPTDVLMTTTYGELNLAGADPILPVFRNAKITYQTLTADRTYALPNASGTIALTSDISGGLPTGGTAGQILTKIDSTDYNATWQDNYADWTSVVKHTVKNNGLSGTITKGTAVYVTGSNGTNMLVGRASNTSEATSSKTMGLMQSDITTTGGTQTGFVITEGLLSGLNTAGQNAGDPVWLGVNGALIYGLINKPYAPAHLVFIGIVTKVSAGSGEIFVKVQNGFELKEIHDVDIITTTPTNNQALVYESSSSLWKNKTIDKTFVGLSNVDNTTDANKPVSTATQTALDLKVDKVTGSRLITSAESTLLGNTSGVNTGDETITTIKSKLGITTLSGSNTGDQDLSNLVVKNTAITGATKTKITYDAKGLVTAGADATTADIADSTNKRYQTDNQNSFNDATSSIQTQLNAKQNTLVSGTDIKSVNGISLLGSGDLSVKGIHALVKPSAGGSVSVSVTSTALSAQVQIANRLIVSPFIPAQTITCSSLYINVATLAVGSNAQILIYSNLNGKPDTKIYQSANLDCSTTGNKIATTTQTFEAGNTYWIGVHTSGIQSLTVISTANLLPIFTTSTTIVSSFFITPTFGSAPTTFGTPSNNSGTIPLVGITI